MNPVQNRIIRNMKAGWMLVHEGGKNYAVVAQGGDAGYKVAPHHCQELLQRGLVAPHARFPDTQMALTEIGWTHATT